MKLYKGDFGEFTHIMSKVNWIKWFDINGNHGSDGWTKSEDWFEDMIKCGLLVEL